MANIEALPHAPSGEAELDPLEHRHGTPKAIKLVSGGGALPLSAADTVLWELRPGVEPWVSEFSVIIPRAEAWLEKTGAEWVSLRWGGRTFSKLRALRGVQTDPWHTMIRVADRRHRWRYVRYFGRHNLRRRVNHRKMIGHGGPDDLRAIWKYRYRQWTINPETGEPWTAQELAIVVLESLLEELGEPLDIDTSELPEDNGVHPDQQEYLGGTHVDCLAWLLDQASTKVCVDQDGTIRFYDPYKPLELPGLLIKGGTLREPDMSRIRPKIVEVFFLAEREKRFIFETTGEERDPTRTDPKDDPVAEPILENVCQMPERGPIAGITREPGTWINVYDAMDAWGIAEEDVQHGIFFGGEILRLKYATEMRGGRRYTKPKEMRRVNSLIQNYRQTFRIQPRYFDQLRSWKPELVTVIDPVTHTRQPSPVWTRWYEQYACNPVVFVMGPPDKAGSNMSSWDEDPPVIAPAEILVLDDDLGVFRVNFFRNIDGTVCERIPSQVRAEPQIFDIGLWEQHVIFTREHFLSPDHRLETVMTVIEGVPNDKSVHHVEVIDKSGEKGLIPKLQIYCRTDTARFDEDGNLRNEEIVKDLADSEAKTVMESYLERPVGVLTVVHRDADRWKCQSHLRGVRFTKSPGGSEAVIIDANEPPPKPNPFKFMPQTTKNFLQRVIPREY